MQNDDRRRFLGRIAALPALSQTAGAWGVPSAHLSEEPAPRGVTSHVRRKYRLWLKDGAERIRERWTSAKGKTLAELETDAGWSHFPHALLPLARWASIVGPATSQGREVVELAVEIGDFLAQEDEGGSYQPRLDSHRDTYMWLEAYRILLPQLGHERAERWRAALERNIAVLVPALREEADLPRYTGVFLGTSPNHFALWAGNVLLGGIVFKNSEWMELGTRILHRFATTEQSPDGFWGEHDPSSPTLGYNSLTLIGVGTYWEWTRRPEALATLQKATHLHAHYTWPNGDPMELMNDRNRHWERYPWAQFAFSHFPEGRGFVEFFVDQMPERALPMEMLGRVAQNDLYYHDGPVTPAPQRRAAYVAKMQGPAGVRKSGEWVVGLCGIIDAPLPKTQWFLTRQSNVAVFHSKCGLIVSGAHSRHQPEIATLSEVIGGERTTELLGSRLSMNDREDVLSLAHHRFLCDVRVARPSHDELKLVFEITGRGVPPDQAQLALQLMLHPGGVIETGAGKRATVGSEKIEWSAGETGGRLSHRGWTLETSKEASLRWPYFPYSPYRNGPETKLETAIGQLVIPLRWTADPKRFLQPNVVRVEISIRVAA